MLLYYENICFCLIPLRERSILVEEKYSCGQDHYHDDQYHHDDDYHHDHHDANQHDHNHDRQHAHHDDVHHNGHRGDHRDDHLQPL